MNNVKISISKYSICEKIGFRGKDGTVYRVEDKNRKSYAMKKFRINKSVDDIRKEVQLQKIAAKNGLSPSIKDVDLKEKWIIMELMDLSFYDKFKKQKGKLTILQQKEIYNILIKLDDIKVFHGDPGILNFMEKDEKLYIIDFGFAKKIDKNLIKQYGENPNRNYMLIGLLVKLKELCPDIKYTHLLKYVPEKDRIGFRL